MYETVEKSDNQSDKIIQEYSEKGCSFSFWDLKALDKTKRLT